MGAERQGTAALSGVSALALLIGFQFQTSPANAQPRPHAAPPDIVVEGKIRDDQRRICKQMTATGSIIPLRTCKTKGEWEDIRTRSIAQVDQLERDQVQQRFTSTSRENCADSPVARC